MNGRERILAALTGGAPDRTPYMELYIDEDFARRALDLPPLTEPSVMSGEAPFTAAYFGGQSYDPFALAAALHLDGLCMSVQPQIYFDVAVADGQRLVRGGRIQSRADLEMVRLVNPDDPALYEPARVLVDRIHAAGLAAACFTNLGSDPVVLSMGWEQLSYALYDDPALVHDLFSIYADWYARAMKHICTLGFDFVWAGDDIAFRSGPMVAPKVFRQVFLPYYRKVAEAITLPWIFHTDGNFLPLLEDLLPLGMNALHPLEPDAVDLPEVKRRLAGRAGIVGNIDINLLAHGTPKEVVKVTRATIHAATNHGKERGGYILSSSNSITRACQVNNVLAMVQACFEEGQRKIEENNA